MTAEEIRKEVSPMVIWMADAAIREARKALTHKTGWSDIHRADFNLPEVEMASAVLYRMFESCEADIRIALIRMPEAFDGISCKPKKRYFDAFVDELERWANAVDHDSMKLREPDRTMERY